MKINEFINESTTAGAVATVAVPMTGGVQKRSDVGKGVYGNEKPGNLLTGKKTSKKYANSISESKMKQLAQDIEYLDDGNFQKKYKKSKAQIMGLLGTPANMKPKSKNEVNEAEMDHQTKKQLIRYADAFRLLQVLEKAGVDVLEVRPGGESTARFLVDINGRKHLLTMNKYGALSEAQLDEEDLIIVPGQGRVKGGFIPHAEDRRDHEVEMARGDLFQAYQNAEKIHKLIKDVSEDEGLEGWVQAKITKASDYLNSVRQYLEGKHVQEMTGGVIAGGGVG